MRRKGVAMRSTNEIIIAVKESQPATDEELRLALLVMSNIDYFVEGKLRELIEAIEEDKPSTKSRARFAKDTLEGMFLARKKPPKDWLGPENTPGTPEYERRYAMAMKLGKKLGVI